MLIFVDSFSHYTNAFLAEKWDVVSYGAGTTTLAQSLTSGRFGAGGVTFASAGTDAYSAYMVKNYNGVGTIIVGMALKQTGIQESTNTGYLTGARWLTFMSGNTVQVRIGILQSGQLIISRGRDVNQGFQPNLPTPPALFVDLGTSVNAISSSSFDFLEVKVIHNSTTGSVEIKRNGAAFYTLSGINTDLAGSGNSSSVIIGGGSWDSGGTSIADRLRAIVCDVAILNTVVDGADALNPVDFIGDRHWEPITPTADATYTAWTPTGSASHFANIDEVPPNTTDYNATATLNAKDSFDVSAPTGPTTASALIALTMYCQKDTGAAVEIKGLMRLAGADRNGTAFQVPNPYAFRQSFLCSKPGGGAITLQNVMDGEFGYERTA